MQPHAGSNFSRVHQAAHSVIFQKFPQKCAPSVDSFKPIRERLQKTKKVKANAQGKSHLPTHLMVPTYRSNTNLFKKISLGTQIFIFCQIWVIENSTMSSKQILIGQLWTREGANIQKITQCGTKLTYSSSLTVIDTNFKFQLISLSFELAMHYQTNDAPPGLIMREKRQALWQPIWLVRSMCAAAVFCDIRQNSTRLCRHFFLPQ